MLSCPSLSNLGGSQHTQRMTRKMLRPDSCSQRNCWQKLLKSVPMYYSSTTVNGLQNEMLYLLPQWVFPFLTVEKPYKTWSNPSFDDAGNKANTAVNYPEPKQHLWKIKENLWSKAFACIYGKSREECALFSFNFGITGFLTVVKSSKPP